MCGRSKLLYEGIDGHHLSHKKWPLESSREELLKDPLNGFLCGVGSGHDSEGVVFV